MRRLHSERQGVRSSGENRQSPICRQDQDATLWDLMDIQKFNSARTSDYLNPRTVDTCSRPGRAARSPIRAHHHSNEALKRKVPPSKAVMTALYDFLAAIQQAETPSTIRSQTSSVGESEEDHSGGDGIRASTFAPGNDAVPEISKAYQPSLHRTVEDVQSPSRAGSEIPLFSTVGVNSQQMRSSDPMTGSQIRRPTQSTLSGLSGSSGSVSMNYQEADQETYLELYRAVIGIYHMAIEFANEPLPTALGDIEASWWPQFKRHVARLAK
jgi:hypothetical protein